MSTIARKNYIIPAINNRSIILGIVVVVSLASLIRELSDDKKGFYLLATHALILVCPFLFGVCRKKFSYIAFVFLASLARGPLAMLNEAVSMVEWEGLDYWGFLAAQEELKCTLITAVGYYFTRQVAFRNFMDKARYEMLSVTSKQLILIALYVLLFPFSIPYIPAGIIIIHYALVAADTVLLFSSTIRGKEKLSWLIRTICLMSTLVHFLKTGHLSMLGNYIAYYLISACLMGKMRGLWVVLVLILIASAVQSVKGGFRKTIQQNPGMSMSERFDNLTTLLTVQYINPEILEDEEEDRVGELSKGFSRVGENSLARVLQWTPAKVPFWNGETYATLPFIFIPRFFWADKPSRHHWNKFGRVYGILSSNDYQTSVAFSYYAEAYMNFGFSALYLVSIFMGIFVCFIERFGYHILGGHFFFTYMVLLLPLTQHGSDLTSIIHSEVLAVCVLLLTRPIFRNAAKRDAYGFTV